MGRKRVHGKGLPSRWRYRSGAYYYRVPPGLEFQWDGRTEYMLGRTLSEAHLCFAAKIKPLDNASRLRDVMERYRNEVVQNEAIPDTWVCNRSFDRIMMSLGDAPINQLTPERIHAYLEQIALEESQAQANQDSRVIDEIFQKALDWGIAAGNPLAALRAVPQPGPFRARKGES